MDQKPSRGSGGAGQSARAVALAILLASQRTDDTLDELIERRATSFRDPRDRGLVMELVYGALRRQETIDWRLGAVLAKPLQKLPVIVQMVLRLGAYQLLFLDRIPHSAAVNESVALAKSYSHHLKRDWSGLVNGVLRNLIRTPEPALPSVDGHPVQSLSVQYGIPEWLVERWLRRMEREQVELASRMMGRIPAVTLRVNRLRRNSDELVERLRHAGIPASPTDVSPVGVVLEKGQDVTSLPGFEIGEFYVEDEAAQLIPPILDPQPGEVVLDACAAPGGKTTHLGELMGDRGSIYALDRSEARLARIQENAKRLAIRNIVPVVGDARKPGEWAGSITRSVPRQPAVPLFDRILVDAPCSGIGVLRRHPEAKLRKDSSAFARHQTLQFEILTSVASCLRPGGVLVYSTCSTETEETEEVVTRFCEASPGWMRESVAPWLPPTALPFVTVLGALSTMGNAHGMDGFYAVRLRKKGS